MITGEAAQDFVDVQDAAAGGVAGSNTTNTHHSSASANTAAGAAASGVVSNGFPAAAASAAATTTTSLAQGAFGVAAAGARAANRRAQMLSQSVAGMVPQGWQLQKWPTEASESRRHGGSRSDEQPHVARVCLDSRQYIRAAFVLHHTKLQLHA